LPVSHQGAPVKTAGECDHGGALGVIARDLDGIFDSLGAGIQEHGLFRCIARRESVEALRQPQVRLVRGHMKASVRECLRLPRDRLHHLGVAVAGIDHADAGREIDETPPIHVPELGVLRSGDINPLGAHSSRRRFACR